MEVKSTETQIKTTPEQALQESIRSLSSELTYLDDLYNQIESGLDNINEMIPDIRIKSYLALNEPWLTGYRAYRDSILVKIGSKSYELQKIQMEKEREHEPGPRPGK